MIRKARDIQGKTRVCIQNNVPVFSPLQEKEVIAREKVTLFDRYGELLYSHTVAWENRSTLVITKVQRELNLSRWL